ncbi:hypothetical protein HZH68_006556 [Vespula germanica]|uniref:Uncharacterized protein n=1 Tax=Vespula germanica TaxID=30212 RepID=A0A834KBR9_VESGE|nr:hypothetical protein HZH68_006556 [Vespula germanica]
MKRRKKKEEEEKKEKKKKKVEMKEKMEEEKAFCFGPEGGGNSSKRKKRRNPCPASGLYYSTTTTTTKKKKKKKKKIIGENICPAFARALSERIGLTRGGHIYFGDSLSTRSLKIERLYKSSPIRERVLNARTSALPEKGVRAAEKRRAPASEADLGERIYWTCLGEESRLVAVATSCQSLPPRKPIKSVDSPKRF